MKLAAGILGLAILAASLGGAQAVTPDEMLQDQTLEARARALSAGLRCLVCQNQSIDESEATVARDLRVLIREQIKGGKSDDQVMAFIVERYGDYVLLQPRFKPSTYVLWLAPFALLFAGFAFAFRQKAPTGDSKELTAAEKAELETLLRK